MCPHQSGLYTQPSPSAGVAACLDVGTSTFFSFLAPELSDIKYAFFPSQISGATSDVFERWISRTVFWSYCLVAPPVTMGFALIAVLITRL